MINTACIKSQEYIVFGERRRKEALIASLLKALFSILVFAITVWVYISPLFDHHVYRLLRRLRGVGSIKYNRSYLLLFVSLHATQKTNAQLSHTP